MSLDVCVMIEGQEGLTWARWERLARAAQGEPKVADASQFYESLEQRLEQAQELPAEALQHLGERRASTIVETLVAGGVAAERASATAAKPVDGTDKAVPLTLELSAR